METLELLSALSQRKSVRAYQTKEIENEKLHLILEAARWAPSSLNEQPWRYIVGKRGDENFEKIAKGLLDANKVWASIAPVLILSFAKKKFTRNGVMNKHALYDTGAANAMLSVQASELGLQVHQMGGIKYEELNSIFGLDPEEFEITSVLAVGYPDSPEVLPSPLKERELAPRVRRELNEIVSGL